MPRSILEAIKIGIWDFEPPEVALHKYDATDAMPGTREKLDALARRLESGLPLWHLDDRSEVDAPPPRPRPR